MFVPRAIVVLSAALLMLCGTVIVTSYAYGQGLTIPAPSADMTSDLLQIAGRALGWVGGILATVLAVLGALIVYVANELWSALKILGVRLGLLENAFTAHSSTAIAKLDQLERGHTELKQDAASARDSATRRAKQLHEVQDDVSRAIDIAAQSQARVEAIAFRVGVTGEIDMNAIKHASFGTPSSETSIRETRRKGNP